MQTARYRYRFYPTPEQARQLACQFGCVRYVYNWALALKSEAFRERGEKIGYAETSRRMTRLRADTVWLQDVSQRPLAQSLRHLDKAYTAFFRGNAKYPQFKSKHGAQSATYSAGGFRFNGANLSLAKQAAPLRVVWTRPLPSQPSSLTIIREPGGRYYVSFVVQVDPQPFAKTKRSVGIDLGLTDVVATSDGWKSGNPRHLQREERKLARAQKALARKQKGSANREKARRKVARIHVRVRNQRSDYLHQMTTRLVRRYDVIACESLAVKNMVRHPTLAKHIHGAGWGMLVQMLAYKCEWYGKTLVQVDRWLPSTKTCSACHAVTESLPLDVRRWTCRNCGAEHDRDVNAALNILAAGRAVTACGDGVSPPLALVSGVPVGEAGSALGHDAKQGRTGGRRSLQNCANARSLTTPPHWLNSEGRR